MSKRCKCFLHKGDSLFAGADFPVQLCFFNGVQNFLEGGAGPESEVLQVIPGKDACRTDLLGLRFRQKTAHKFVVFEVPMARKAVQTVQFHVLLEAVEPHEAFQGGRLHLQDVLEAQMIRNERRDLVGVFTRETQTGANLGGHLLADFNMLVEANAPVRTGRRLERGRLTDVMEQDAPSERT